MITKKFISPIFDNLKINFLLLALAGSLLFYGEVPAADTTGPDTALADIIVSLKLDPRLTRGLYMGDRWVSSSHYTSALQVGKQATVEARATGRDTMGKPMGIKPEWIAADPDMVEVSPAQGSVVTIIVKRVGESRLNVISQGVSKVLHVQAMAKGSGMQLVISE